MRSAWPTAIKVEEKHSNFGYYIENDFHCNHVMEFFPKLHFIGNWLIIGIVSAKGLRKNVLVLQVGGHAPAPPTPPVFRVVLLHTEGTGKKTCPDSV